MTSLVVKPKPLAIDARERELWLYLSFDDYTGPLVLQHLNRKRQELKNPTKAYMYLKATPAGPEPFEMSLQTRGLRFGEGARRIGPVDATGYTPWLVVEAELSAKMRQPSTLLHYKIRSIGGKLALEPRGSLAYRSVELI